jgi:predicted transcriptional regulator
MNKVKPAEKALRVIQNQPFVWQESYALRLIRESFGGMKVTIAKGIYTTLTEIANNQHNQSELITYLSSIYTMCEMDERTVKPYLDKFKEIGLIEISEQERDKGKYGKVIILIKSQLSPSNIPRASQAQTAHKSGAQNPDIKKHLTKPSLRSISKKKGKITKKAASSVNDEYKAINTFGYTAENAELITSLKDDHPEFVQELARKTDIHIEDLIPLLERISAWLMEHTDVVFKSLQGRITTWKLNGFNTLRKWEPPPDLTKQARMDELMRQIEVLNDEWERTRRDLNDYAGADEFEAKVAPLREEYLKLKNENG